MKSGKKLPLFETTRRHLFLAGFMGTGKTVVGGAVAKRLGWAFIDLDDMIVSLCQRSIPDIFRLEGEDAFRLHEARALRLAVISHHSVIALGGGTPMLTPNANIIRATGRCWLLTASCTDIWARVRGNLAERPLLSELVSSSGAGQAQFERFLAIVQPVMQQRKRAYSLVADHELATSGLSIEELAQRITNEFHLDLTITAAK